MDCIHPHAVHGEPLGILKFFIPFHSSFSLLRIEELSHYFNRSLCITCRLWVELISDLLLFGTSLPLPLEHDQSISCTDTFYHGKFYFYWYHLFQCSQAKEVMPTKMQYCCIILFNAMLFTKGILLEIKEIFLHPSH